MPCEQERWHILIMEYSISLIESPIWQLHASIYHFLIVVRERERAKVMGAPHPPQSSPKWLYSRWRSLASLDLTLSFSRKLSPWTSLYRSMVSVWCVFNRSDAQSRDRASTCLDCLPEERESGQCHSRFRSIKPTTTYAIRADREAASPLDALPNGTVDY